MKMAQSEANRKGKAAMKQSRQAEQAGKPKNNGAGPSGLTREQLRQSGAVANNARQTAAKNAANKVRSKGKGRAPPPPPPPPITKEEINKLRRQAEQAESEAKKFSNIAQGAGSSGLSREQLRQAGAAANRVRQANKARRAAEAVRARGEANKLRAAQRAAAAAVAREQRARREANTLRPAPRAQSTGSVRVEVQPARTSNQAPPSSKKTLKLLTQQK